MPKFFYFIISFLLFFPFFSQGANSLDVAINEIAWMGTKANSSDEWIELYNNANQAISLEGWALYEAGGEISIEPLTGSIEAKSYYLIERTDDTTISDIPASQEPSSWAGYGLKNSGEHLQLLDQNSLIIDEVNCSGGWFAGEAGPNYKTMERKDPQGLSSEPNNWTTNNGEVLNGEDSEGNPINGTPKAENSVSVATEPPTQSEPEPESQTKPETQSAENQQQEEEPQPLTYPSGIVINEILPSPEGPDAKEEWTEIFNQNNFEVELSEWQITDTIGSTNIYTFPEGTKIGPKGFLVLYRPTIKVTLNNSGDGILLIQPNGNMLDKVTYKKAPRGQSYNRTESGWAWSTILTPESANIIPRSVSESGEAKPSEEKIEEPSSQKEQKEYQTKRELAAIGEQIPKGPSSFLPFSIALIIAIFSGIIILILKRKIKTE